MSEPKTITIVLHCKNPDAFEPLRRWKGSRRHLEFGEYARIEVEVAEDWSIVDGRFVPTRERE